VRAPAVPARPVQPNPVTSASGLQAGRPDTATWMKSLSGYLQDQKLSDIVIPASHDTGTYPILPGLAQAQDHDITQQLNDGMRSFDIRVKWVDSDADCAGVPGYYAAHGPAIGCVQMREMFQQISQWATAPGHDQEIVLIGLQIDTTNGPSIAGDCSQFANDLGPALLTPSDLYKPDLPTDPGQLTPRELASLPGHPRVILNNSACLDASVPGAGQWSPDPPFGASSATSYYANQCYAQAYAGQPGIWGADHPAAQRRSTDGSDSGYSTGYTEWSKNPMVGGLWTLFVQATPTLGCPPPFFDFLKEFVGEQNLVLSSLSGAWPQDPKLRANVNIISGDFVELSDLFATAWNIDIVKFPPMAPTIGHATPGDGSAQVSFSLPNNGALPVTSYTVTAVDRVSGTAKIATGSASPITLRGLTNGDSYTLSVTATNSVGSGYPSDNSNVVVPSADAGKPYTAVTNSTGNSVTEYAKGSSGDDFPVATISGASTGLDRPSAAAFDPAGNLFVANQGGDSVTEYGKGATGNAAPIATIKGANTALDRPSSVAVAPDGTLLVENYTHANEYPTGATGNIAPIATLPAGEWGDAALTVDQGGSVFVVEPRRSAIRWCAKQPDGSWRLAGTISGPHTGLSVPDGVAVDATGHLFVADRGNSSVTEYATPTLNNGVLDVAPIATIQGPVTGLAEPSALALDPFGDVFVTNRAANSVTKYTNGASGNTAPVATLTGPSTGLAEPSGIATLVTGTPPTAPSVTTVQNGDGQATVGFSGAASDSAPITAYTASATDHNRPAATPVTASGPRSPITVKGLINGDTYTFTVTATNAFGTSPPSAPSNPVTPSVDAGRPYFVVTNPSVNSITEYSKGSSGDDIPVAMISGTSTGLNHPSASAFDSAGNLFVANQGAGSVTEYARGATGNVAPVTTIKGANTYIIGPQGLAFDAAGDLFVSNSNAAVTKYSKGATGNVTPTDVVPTGGVGGCAIAVDPAGTTVYCPDTQLNYISRMSKDPGGWSAKAVIGGPHTGLNSPDAVALDAAGNVFVANRGTSSASDSVTEYAAPAAGNQPADVAPTATIQGPATGLAAPSGLTQDPAGNLLVSNAAGPGSVTAYPHGATGNTMPLATLTGPGTELAQPSGIALVPTGTPPGAPSVTTLQNGDGQVTVGFAGAGAGTAPITGYTVSATDRNRPTAAPVTASGPVSPITVKGLTNGDPYTFAVTATSAAGTSPPSAPSGALNVGVVPVIVSGPEEGTVGVPYASSVRVTGAPAPTITANALPPGLTLAPDGKITGTPTAAGPYSIIVRADNHVGQASKTFPLTISPPRPGG
jgi:large repetitive protein